MPENHEKVRGLIEHMKSRTDQLVSGGVDRESLTDRLAALDQAVAEQAHGSVIGQKLTELKAELEEAAGNPTVLGAIALLNEIFATGVPSPR